MNKTRKITNIIRNSALELLDIKSLLRRVTGLSSAQLITQSDYMLTETEYSQLIEWEKRRLNGEPLNYILGVKEFYSHEFKVTKDTLIPRPETELLVDSILKMAHEGAKILELGTGCGCIAIACWLNNPTLKITACDKYQQTLAIAIENANNLKANITFLHSNWFSNISGTFDFIISNPPYIAFEDEHLKNLQYEPQPALTDFNDGLDCIKHIITTSAKFLNPSGLLMFEHGYDQGEISRELMIKAGFYDVSTIKDYAQLERITCGRYKK